MPKKISRFRRIKQDVLALWDESFHADEELSRLHKFLHFWVLVVKSFRRNRCPIRASALSYTTLLALIPILAVAISITSSLLKRKGEQQIYQVVDSFVSRVVPPAEETNNTPQAISPPDQSTAGTQSSVRTNSAASAQNSVTNITASSASDTNTVSSNLRSGDEEVRLTAAQKKVASQIYGFVQNARSGAIAGVGMLVLVYAAIRMLTQVETTFNDIWGVTRGRSWWMRIVIYWTVITLGPLLLAGALALASGPHLHSTQKFLMKMPGVGALTFKLLPLILLWLTFTLFYKAVPNIKVRWNAALVGGLVGGTAWQVNNWLGFLYVSRVVTYSKMYGGLGMVPVFMLGLYFSWLILLFGAQVAYAFQNRALYLQERIAENVNQRGREFVALRLMTCIGQRFQRGLCPATGQQMSEELCIPSRLVQQVLQTLMGAQLVIEIAGAEPGYSPGRPLERINAHHILEAMRARGQELLTRNEPVREEVFGEFARIQDAEKSAASSVTMLALVNRADARLELTPLPAPEETVEVTPVLAPPETGQSAPPSEPAPEPEPMEFQSAPELPKSEPAIAKQKPVADLAEKTTHSSKPITKPMPDEERDFPL